MGSYQGYIVTAPHLETINRWHGFRVEIESTYLWKIGHLQLKDIGI